MFRLCAQCREPAIESCARCDKPLCTKHKTAPSSRCNACEARFLEVAPVYIPSRALQVGSSAVFVAGLLATLAVGALVVTQANIASWSLVALVSGLAGLQGVRGLLSRKEANKLGAARKVFLLERPGDLVKSLPKRSLKGPDNR